jgi:hypothetical protein
MQEHTFTRPWIDPALSGRYRVVMEDCEHNGSMHAVIVSGDSTSGATVTATVFMLRNVTRVTRFSSITAL